MLSLVRGASVPARTAPDGGAGAALSVSAIGPPGGAPGGAARAACDGAAASSAPGTAMKALSATMRTRLADLPIDICAPARPGPITYKYDKW